MDDKRTEPFRGEAWGAGPRPMERSCSPDLDDHDADSRQSGEIPPLKLVGEDAAMGEAGAAASPAASPSMAGLVTRHAGITAPTDWKFLACGIDTLDIGYYVTWNRWDDLFGRLTVQRDNAQRSDDDLAVWHECGDRPALMYASSGKRNYRFHLERDDVHFFLATYESPKAFPNVYVSLGSKLLWQDGVPNAVKVADELIKSLGGVIEQRQPSRCDLAVDYLIPEGIEQAMIESQRVCKSRSLQAYKDGDKLQTVYIGKKQGSAASAHL